ncbi:ABC transporter permease [Streptomyces sp. NBC_01618]|uniref:ABC transporter permease n=1 Tax=Streptomyces sp. NBC_01618 TaxID=2975900 RepID=UPI0038695C03|nr:ABC transporter permease [Streptomyces sp. NBC_01618]
MTETTLAATAARPRTEEADLATWATEEQGRRVRSRRRHRTWVWSLRIGLLATGLLIWQLLASDSASSAITISSPGAVFDYLREQLPTSEYWTNIGVTMKEAGIGFGLSAVAAVFFAFLLSSSPLVTDVMNPLLNFLNSLPRIAFAPLFIAWFGLGELPQIVLVFTLCFFVVLNGAMVGLASVDPDLKLLSEQLGVNHRSYFTKVRWPHAVPSIFGALRLSLIYSFLGAMTGEMLTGNAGAGAEIAKQSGLLQMDAVFGILFTLGVVVSISVELLRAVESRLCRWQKV